MPVIVVGRRKQTIFVIIIISFAAEHSDQPNTASSEWWWGGAVNGCYDLLFLAAWPFSAAAKSVSSAHYQCRGGKSTCFYLTNRSCFAESKPASVPSDRGLSVYAACPCVPLLVVSRLHGNGSHLSRLCQKKKYLWQQALTHTSPFTLRNGQTEMPSNINENVAYKKMGEG